MRRRSLLAALAVLPFTHAYAIRAHAQSTPVVGFLNSASLATYSFNANAFREGLREAGFVEGQNVVIEYRWADNDYGRLPALATDLVRRRVAVIAATGDISSARAAQAATTDIPIVFTVGSDPVPFGLVTSLSRPTGNATGVTLFSSTLMAKRLEFLRDVAPNAQLIAMLMNPDNLNYRVDVEAAEADGRPFSHMPRLPANSTPRSRRSPKGGRARYSSRAIRCFWVSATGSQPWEPSTRYRSSRGRANSQSPVPCSLMERASPGCIARRASIADGYSKGRNPPIFRSFSPRNSISSSI
jgi:hypothetical protein